MKKHGRVLSLIGLTVVMPLLAAAGERAQELQDQFYARPQGDQTRGSLAAPHPFGPIRCRGPVNQVSDLAFEGVKVTGWNWAMMGGGGEGGRYDPLPVLSTTVNLTEGCLNAHFSAIVGSRQTYGAGISALTMFQVALTPAGGAP